MAAPTLTDVTSLTPEQKGTYDISRQDFTGWWHKHPISAPYGVVRNGVLSCFEMSPHDEMHFLLGVGRKYLLQFYDKYDDLTTANWEVSAFKMLPDEHVVLSTAHKAPYNRWLPHRAFVRRSTVAKWPLQLPSINWKDVKINLLPNYAVGRLDDQECADVHDQYMGTDAAFAGLKAERLTPKRLQQAYYGEECVSDFATGQAKCEVW